MQDSRVQGQNTSQTSVIQQETTREKNSKFSFSNVSRVKINPTSSCVEEQLQANAKLAVCGSLSALTERLRLTSDQFEIKSQQMNRFFCVCQNYKSVSSSVECVFKSHINACDR